MTLRRLVADFAFVVSGKLLRRDREDHAVAHCILVQYPAAAMLAAEIPKSAIALRREKNILISHILLHESSYHVLP
jgi:hypothetical protein